MKPIALSFQNFGSYRAMQQIDFRQLYDAGLFLITGSTGGGKTTILDAMCCALYGCSSGNSQEELSMLRSRHAGEREETMVSFTFDMHGQRYTFTRRLAKKRINFEESYSLTVLKDGVEHPLKAHLTKTIMKEQAEKIVGLTYQQFSQIMILPQGKFGEFLTADSASKSEILSQLFQLQSWKQMLDVMKEELAVRKAKRDQVKVKLDGILELAKVSSMEELQAASDIQRQALMAMEQEIHTLEQAKHAAAAQMEAALLVEKDFIALKEAQRRLEGLEALREDKAHSAALLHRLQQLQTLEQEYYRLQQGRAELKKVRSILTQQQQALTQQQHLAQQTQQALHLLEAQEVAMEGKTKEKIQLEQAADLYKRRDELMRQGKGARAAAEEAGQRAKRAEEEMQQAAAKLAGLREERNQAENAYTEMLQVYLFGISAELAENLTEGKPCPVCGSVHHPAPARPHEGMVTKNQLEKAEKQKDQLAKEVQRWEQQEKEMMEKLDACRKHAGETEALLLSLRAQMKEVQDKLIPDIPTMAVLQERIDQLGRDVGRHKEQLAAATTRKTESDQKLHTLQGQIQTSQEDLDQRQYDTAQVEQLLMERLMPFQIDTLEAYEEMLARFPSIPAMQDEQTAYATSLKTAQQDLTQRKKAVDGKPQPQREALEAEKNRTETAYIQARDSLVAKKEMVDSMAEWLKSYQEMYPQWEKMDSQLQELDQFCQRLSPRSGISLPRFVMGIYFQHIVEEASRQLQKVHGGRYQMRIASDASGGARLAGLELEVLDSTHAGARPVKSLSGGETFLASLCLAIGLTTRLQAHEGATINAMFVDEGFGSLDRSSLEDALEVLNVARAGHAGRGLVGIISHVDALKEVISSRIEVTADPKGSRLTVRV